ncbi:MULTISPECIES: DUF1127 domain-containing protein [unclassified Bradyrhizobium]
MKTTELGQTIASTQHVFRAFEAYWFAFQAWRERERARAALYALNDSDLRDMGITRGEIYNVTANSEVQQR